MSSVNKKNQADQVIAEAQSQAAQNPGDSGKPTGEFLNILKQEGIIDQSPQQPQQQQAAPVATPPADPGAAATPPADPGQPAAGNDHTHPFTLPGTEPAAPAAADPPKAAPKASDAPAPTATPEPLTAPAQSPASPFAQPAFDHQSVVNAAAEAAVRAVTPQAQQPEVPQVEIRIPEGLNISEEIARRLMADQPERYGNLASELNKASESYDQHVARWQAANPEKSFDPSDDEHSAFFDRLNSGVRIHEPDIDLAERAIIREEVTKDVRADQEKWIKDNYGEKFDQIERQAKEQALNQDLMKHTPAMEDALIKAVRPDEFGKPGVTRESVTQDILQDKLAVTLAGQVRSWQEPLIKQGVSLLGMHEKFDSSKPEHVQFDQSLGQIEQKLVNDPALLGAAAQATGNVGKQLVSYSQWNQLTPAQKAGYWSILDQGTFVGVVNEMASTSLREQYSSIKGQFTPQSQQPGVPQNAQQQNQAPVEPLTAPAQSPSMTPGLASPPGVTPQSLPNYAGISPDGRPTGIDEILSRVLR